jgi:coproporphyrinogen III oxidase
VCVGDECWLLHHILTVHHFVPIVWRHHLVRWGVAQSQHFVWKREEYVAFNFVHVSFISLRSELL